MLVFPVIHTPRLRLRKLEVEDFAALVQYANNPKVSDNIINIPYPYREPDAAFRLSYVVQGFNNKSRLVFAIEHRERAEIIGEISLHFDEKQPTAQLGYWVGEPFWNQGFATEAIGAVLDFGYQRLQLDLVYATVHVDNKASEKVLLNNGMALHHTVGNVMQFRKMRQP